MDHASIHPTDADANLSASLSSALLSSAELPASERYILTHVGARQLVFPSHWVTEILLVERSQILPLPFYSPVLLGVFHHHSQIIPLVAVWQVLAGATAPTREILSVVQLNDAAPGLAGVGIVVDRASDNRLREQFPVELFSPTPSAPHSDSQPHTDFQLFHPKLLGDNLWQPQRWRPSNFDRLGNV